MASRLDLVSALTRSTNNFVTVVTIVDVERIVIDGNHYTVPIDYVTPLYIKRFEQIHRVDELPQAILINPDLL